MAELHGLINLHKPVGITSAKSVYRVRSITRQRKSGHAGTLDPGASGVLIICLGRATKLVERLMDLPKVYRATARLDVTSESLDSDRPWQPVEVAHVPEEQEVRQACAAFEGLIQQVPPDISAVKVGGRPAYRRARRREPLELKPRPVTVYWVDVHRYAWPDLDFELACGRGTYVRALIRDLGGALSTGGCLTSLVRSQVGPFTLDEAWTFERLGAADDPGRYVIPIERAGAVLSDARIPPRAGVG
jgi:tRNA pseudouridine55 synthase